MSHNTKIDMACVPGCPSWTPRYRGEIDKKLSLLRLRVALIRLLSSLNVTMRTTQRYVVAKLCRKVVDMPGSIPAINTIGTRPQEHYPEYILSVIESMGSG